MKVKIHFISSTWKNEDIDITPNIKVRYSKRTTALTDEAEKENLKLLTIGFCWLKFALLIHVLKHRKK